MFWMDTNSHHRDWLGSKHTAAAGKAARAFTLDYGMKQFIDFPTHSKGNILVLIISDLWWAAAPLSHLGSSDHVNILFNVKMDTAMPGPPPGRKVYHWKTAPWDRIRGGTRAVLRGCKANDFKTVDADWWHTVKLHGASESRSPAAPSAEKLADYFSEKLSLDFKMTFQILEFQVKRTFLLSVLHPEM